MADFGTRLMSTFFDAAYPMTHGIEELELVSWDEVVELFWSLAPMFKAEAEASGEPWSVAAVAQADLELRKIAETGQSVGDLRMPGGALTELWRRCRYVIVAAQLEADQGAPLNLPVPRYAPDRVKGAGVMLYMLGGPGRSYPPAMFPD